MHHIDDDELLDELKQRFEENRIAIGELRKLTEELETVNGKLKESEGLKSHFLSNIRNEINNPLTAIMGAAELLTHNPDADSIYSMASIIRREAFNLDFQLRTIFTAAEMEAGEIQMHPSQVDVEPFIKRIIQIFQPSASIKNIKILLIDETDKVNKKSVFRTDPEKLQLIISNLTSNALEYSPAGKDVIIRFKIQNEYLHLSVADQGIGIALEDHERIFDRFVQLDEGMTKLHPGHGLGLSVVRGLLDLMDGRISVFSEVGKGSIFNVELEEISSPPAANTAGSDDDGLLF
jgi:signal transduction histidine kinase